MRDNASEAISPAISAMARPWKMGSNRMTLDPTTTADAVFVTRNARCIRVSVARTGGPDVTGAGAIAGVLVAG